MAKINLINGEEFRKCLGIQNLQDSFINTCVALAQDKVTQVILGTQLYEVIQEKKENNELVDENEPYTILFNDYIKPQLIWQTAKELCIFTTLKLRNAGVVQNQHDYINTVSSNEIELLANQYAANADFYSKRLSDYLRANRKLYPEYCKWERGDIKHSESYNTHIYLGK